MRFVIFRCAAWYCFAASILWGASECSAADAESKLITDFSARFSRRYAVILVPLQLNGKTLELMLSTSSTYTVLDARFRSLLQESATNVTIKSRETVSLHKQPPPLSSDGNNVCQLETIACMDLSSFCEAGGIWCDGILGLDFLRSALVVIDFDTQRISFRVPRDDDDSYAGHEIPLFSTSTGRFATHLSVGGNEAAMPCIVDLSGLFNCAVPGGVFDNLVMRGQVVVSNSLGVSDHVRFGRGSVRIGGIVNDDVVIQRQADDQSATLGLYYWKRFNMTLDIKGQRLYLRPNRAFRDFDHSDLDGICPIRNSDGQYVVHVEAGSVAWAAGLRQGDVLVRVNGRDVKELSLPWICRLLEGSLKEDVRLDVARDNSAVAVTLRRSAKK